MDPLTFALPKPKPKIKKKVLIGGLIAILLIIAGAVFIWAQKTGKIPKVDFGFLSGQLTLKTAQEGEEETTELPPELKEGNFVIIENQGEGIGGEIVSAGKTYEIAAEKNEGITHLARRALKEYLAGGENNPDLTPEHKVYIEDYIQNQKGDRELMLAEKITISEDLIVEAINTSRKLTPEQLENLKQYSVLVPSLSY